MPMVFFWIYLGIWLYLKLLGKIGTNKASYVNILTHVVVLCLSTMFENYEWSTQNIIGCLLVISGNFIILSKNRLII